jgi:uncharacterized membrane protein YeaQ/YmgE (transglycosylase-associated protein family)
MHVLWTILIGFFAGLLAKIIVPGRDPGGFIITTLLGIVGAVVAKWIGVGLGFYRPEEAAGFIAAVIGAIVLLIIYHLLFRRSRTT